MEPKVFAERLLAWFDAHGRKGLPWQENPTPYRVWVSEVMLQQTQVSTVIPYYGRFMARFPSIEALAAGPIDEVLHLWTGLGYYARARNLHACARVIVERHGGTFPRKLEEVTALPGIGRSTAGAILALSRGERHPILDGNAKRVLARVFGIGGDPSSKGVLNELWARADACTPQERAAAYTQAIMDLGATLCTRTRPACTVCPMSEGCVAALEGRQAVLPGVRQRRERGAREAVLLLAESGKDAALAVLVERRPSSGIWGGLWSPPEFESESEALEWCRRELGELESSEALAPIDHAFTHFDLRLNPLRVRVCRAATTTATATARVAVAAARIGTGTGAGDSRGVREGDDRLWYALEAPPKVGLPQPIHELFARMRTSARA
jgi:A/G-specific adenine glycosylase